MVRRAEVAQPGVRFGGDPLGQRLGQAGLAYTRFGGNQHHPSAAGLRLRPAAEQQLHFLVAADQRRGAGRSASKRLSSVPSPSTSHAGTATDKPLSSTVPRSWHANSPPICRLGGRVDHHLTGPARPWRRAARFGVSPTAVCWRESPEPIGSPTTTSPVAMPTRTCSGSPQGRRADCGSNGEAGTHRAFGIGLTGFWPTEIDQHPVTHIPGDEAIELLDRCDDARLVGAYDLPQVFGVEPRRECGGTDEIAEHHAEGAPFGCGLRRARCRFGSVGGLDEDRAGSSVGASFEAQRGDRLQQAPTMAD